MNKIFVSSILALLITILACRPVIAIGWNEFLIIAIVFAVLLGPPLYRLMSRVEQLRKHVKKKEKE
jgi:hypothetical protein